MTNMLTTIVPKSDQLNADDLIGGVAKTIKIAKVSLLAGEQPVALNYEGDEGKPYKPCKSMRRVLVNVWGSDGNLYIGRSMTLYRDDKVTFGGVNVGGIRISHMSHITEPMTMALTATQKSRKPFTVQPLVAEEAPTLENALADIAAAPTLDGLKFKHDAAVRAFTSDDARKKIIAAKDKRKSEITKPKE
jgi:hypothetical protein